MKNYTVIEYLAFSVLLYGLFIGSELLLEYLDNLYRNAYKESYLIFGLMILGPMLMGVLLGVDKVRRSGFKSKGSWQTDWYRLLILGLPAFIIVLSFVLSLLGISSPIYKFPKWYILIKQETIIVSSLILGYVLGSSFHRGKYLY